jgi:hypothetical protein
MSINSFRSEVESLSDGEEFEDEHEVELDGSAEHGYSINTRNAFTGTIGAFLFALAGGVLWFVIYQIGFIAGLAGAVTVALSLLGFALFGNGMNKYGIVISIVISAAVIFLSVYFCAAKDIYDTFKYWYSTGESEYPLTFIQAVRNVSYLLTDEGKTSYRFDLVIGYVLSAVSFFMMVPIKARRKKQ